MNHLFHCLELLWAQSAVLVSILAEYWNKDVIRWSRGRRRYSEMHRTEAIHAAPNATAIALRSSSERTFTLMTLSYAASVSCSKWSFWVCQILVQCGLIAGKGIGSGSS